MSLRSFFSYDEAVRWYVATAQGPCCVMIGNTPCALGINGWASRVKRITEHREAATR